VRLKAVLASGQMPLVAGAPLGSRAVALLGVLALALLGAAAAQTGGAALEGECLSELRGALPPASASNPGSASGGDAVVAVELLAAMVRLAEPALPELRRGSGPIAAGEPGSEAARFLHRRRMLPSGWTPEAHDSAAWQAMLREFAGKYRAEAPAEVGVGREGMLRDAAATLESVSSQLRPLAVFATGDEDEVVFFAVVWNWTPVPRLLLMRPPPGLRLAEGRTSSDRAAPVLEAMSTCALRFTSFVYAGEELALRMFIQQGESTLRVLASEPRRDGWPLDVQPDRVIDVFLFEAPELDGVDVIAGAVEGPSIGIGTALAVIATARMNVGLDGILYHMAFP
jgi:hypothetical protein